MMKKTTKPSYYTKALIFFALFLWPLWSLKMKVQKPVRQKAKKILIIPQLTRIGDIICATPIIRALHDLLPESKVSVLVSGKAAGVLKYNPRIHEIILFGSYSGYDLIKKLRQEHFDTVFILSGTAQASALSFLSFIPERIKLVRTGRPFSEMITDWLNTKKFLYRDGSYLPDFYLSMLSALGVKASNPIKEIFTSDQGEIKAELFLKEHHLDGKRLVGMSLSAGNQIKEWPIERFVSVAEGLMRSHDIFIVLIGPEADREKIRAFCDRKPEALWASGFTLEELPSLLKRFSLFVSVDTGTMHIAHSLNVPIVDIIGPVIEGELTPRTGVFKIVHSSPRVPPSIFSFKKSGPPPLTRNALMATSVDAVLEACRSLLQHSQ